MSHHRSGHATPAQRLWPHVDRSGGAAACWPWLGETNQKGYGRITMNKTPRVRLLAHRVAWEIANGPVPSGLWVLHHCDHPGCCNPRHLWLGTNRDNVLDMWRKGRAPMPPRRPRDPVTGRFH